MMNERNMSDHMKGHPQKQDKDLAMALLSSLSLYHYDDVYGDFLNIFKECLEFLGYNWDWDEIDELQAMFILRRIVGVRGRPFSEVRIKEAKKLLESRGIDIETFKRS